MSFRKLDALLHRDGPKGRETKAPAGPKILVVDDDPGIRDALGTVLGDAYVVVTCASGEEALEALSTEISAVVLDIKMKGHDGFWVCDRIRERYPYLPVLFYSAHQDAKDPLRILNEHRPFAYLGKDGDASALREALGRATRIYAMISVNERMIESLERQRGR